MTDPEIAALVERLSLMAVSEADLVAEMIECNEDEGAIAEGRSEATFFHTCASALTRLAAEKQELSDENTRLRAALAGSEKACVYCQLPADEIAKCKAGFPGCARMDDMMGCPELGAVQELARVQEANQELAEALADMTEQRNILDRAHSIMQAGEAEAREQAGVLTGALSKIQAWANAYPEDVFIPLAEGDLVRVHNILADAGISMSAMHGQWARHIVSGIGGIASAALARAKGGE